MSARTGSSGRGRPRSALGLERARLAIAMGKWSTARALLEELRTTRPEDAEAASLFALCLVRTGGDLAVARDACMRAIDAQPFVAHHHARLAEVYSALGLARLAATCVQEATRLDPAPAAPRTLQEPRRRGARFRAWLRRARRRGSRPLPV